MLIEPHLLLAWIALAVAVSLTPGPDVLLVASQAARRGARAGLATTAGVTVGGLWFMLLCGFGFLSMLALSPVLFSAVKIAGAAYLAWLGIRLLRGAVMPARGDTDRPGPVHLGAPFRQGLIATMLNPKVALFYVAVLPQFVGSGSDAPLRGVLLIAIHYAINAPWLAIVAFGSDRAGSKMRSGNVLRWIEGVLGVAFISFAGRLAFARNT